MSFRLLDPQLKGLIFNLFENIEDHCYSMKVKRDFFDGFIKIHINPLSENEKMDGNNAWKWNKFNVCLLKFDKPPSRVYERIPPPVSSINSSSSHWDDNDLDVHLTFSVDLEVDFGNTPLKVNSTLNLNTPIPFMGHIQLRNVCIQKIGVKASLNVCLVRQGTWICWWFSSLNEDILQLDLSLKEDLGKDKLDHLQRFLRTYLQYIHYSRL